MCFIESVFQKYSKNIGGNTKMYVLDFGRVTNMTLDITHQLMSSFKTRHLFDPITRNLLR